VQKEDPGFIKEVKHSEESVLQTVELATAAKVLERMVNQNTYNDIAMDFKFWDDASDQFKALEGTLLPLWKFTNERARKKSVTSIAWNPQV
jgi:dynein intermediate chain 1, axonemal